MPLVYCMTIMRLGTYVCSTLCAKAVVVLATLRPSGWTRNAHASESIDSGAERARSGRRERQAKQKWIGEFIISLFRHTDA